jgi:hypothetical protein
MNLLKPDPLHPARRRTKMVDEPGDIVKVKKRTFGSKRDVGRVGTITKVRGKWAKVDFTNFDSQEPRERVYNRKELASIQEAKDMPNHVRKAEKEP